MSDALAISYKLCQRIARDSASSFYYSFLLLPRAKRSAMCALYAFLRRTDDLGDSDDPDDARRAALSAWRRSLDRALSGIFDDPMLPAVADTVARYRIPPEYLHAAIDGVEMDLDRCEYATFADLEQYCYRVASVVGLACVYIWGFRDPAALVPARQCGVAFQLTNILRDLKEDAARGRCYLPREDLDRFDYRLPDLRAGVQDARFRALMQFEIARAEDFYRHAAELDRWLEPDGRRVFGAMLSTYHGLLDQIKRLDGDVFTARVRLSGWRKLRIATRWLFHHPSPAAANSAVPR